MCIFPSQVVRQMLDSADGSMNLALERHHSDVPVPFPALWSSCCPHEIYCNLSLSLPRHRWATIPGSSSWPWLITMWSHEMTLTELESNLHSWFLKHQSLCPIHLPPEAAEWCKYPHWLQDYTEIHSVDAHFCGEISDELSLVCWLSWFNPSLSNDLIC